MSDVWCSRPTSGVLLAPCHDEFREPRSDYVRQCKVGARVVGSCAHVASVLWYLGYWRHNHTRTKTPSLGYADALQDAANGWSSNDSASERRPRQTSRREDRHIVRNARAQPTASSAAIQAQVAPSLGDPVSSQTIRSRVCV
ncbi:hypothetical protein TNCV_2160331 [Trichonephila clavipes]|nr:hypothetical protein TNCV_2160331 [Trichonephila clavipes]